MLNGYLFQSLRGPFLYFFSYFLFTLETLFLICANWNRIIILQMDRRPQVQNFHSTIQYNILTLILSTSSPASFTAEASDERRRWQMPMNELTNLFCFSDGSGVILYFIDLALAHPNELGGKAC